MASVSKKFMLTIPDNIKADAAEIKRNLFYDKPYAEMYRHLIRMGLDSLKTEKAAKKNREYSRTPYFEMRKKD